MGQTIALISLLFGLGGPSNAAVQVAVSSTTQQQTVEVEWNGTWFDAVVLDQNGSKSLIRYVGYDASWDEWVGPDRLRLPPLPVASGQWRPGDPVEVEWAGSWWKATVVATGNGLTKIAYDGYSSSWDEWVEPARIR